MMEQRSGAQRGARPFAYRTIYEGEKRTSNAATPRRPADNKVFNRKTLLTYCPPGGPCPGRSKKEHEKQREIERENWPLHIMNSIELFNGGMWNWNWSRNRLASESTADCLYFDFMAALSAPERLKTKI